MKRVLLPLAALVLLIASCKKDARTETMADEPSTVSARLCASDEVLQQQIDNPDDQRVYDAGSSDAQFTNVDKADDGLRATLSTNGKIGPKVTEEQVKQLSVGKRYGDIKSSIENINGVDSVDIEFSPFWVSKSPNSADKITVEFRLNE